VFYKGEVFEIVRADKEQHVASVLLFKDGEIPLMIYESFPFNSYDLTSKYQETEVRECWAREGTNPKYTKFNIRGGFRLEATDAAACVGIDLPATIAEPTLAEITIYYSSTTGTPPDSCLVKKGEEGCVGKSAYELYGASTKEKQIKLYYQLEAGGDYWLDLTGRGSDEEGEESIVEYKNIDVNLYKMTGGARLAVDIGFMPKEKVVNLTSDHAEQIEIEIPLGFGSGLVEREDWNNARGKITATNCDLFNRGEVIKKISTEGVLYKARNKGVNCDYMPLSGFGENIGFILRLVGENKSGRSIKFVLNSNATRRNELEYLLSDASFDESYVVIPREGEDVNYDFTLETRSFGSSESVNYLAELQTTPLPLNWLKSISVIPDKPEIENNIQVVGVDKRETAYYRVDVEVGDNESLIALSQGYEDGWIAYEMSNIKCEMSNVRCFFPFLFGNKLEHVKVNSWANGWLINSSKLKAQSSKPTDYRSPITDHHTIVIVYWPQYLQYFGFVLLIATAIVLIAKPAVDKKRTRS
jgi:hypothetical protein